MCGYNQLDANILLEFMIVLQGRLSYYFTKPMNKTILLNYN